MLQSDARPTIDYNPYVPGFDENPYPVFSRLRETRIGYWETGHCWLVNRYEDQMAILRDKRFTSDYGVWELAHAFQGAQSTELDLLRKNELIALSEQSHARVRKLVSPSFTPRAIDRLRPMIQGIVDSVLDAMSGEDTVNLVRAVAEPIPVRVISKMLHMPEEHDEQFHTFAVAQIKRIFPSMLGPDDWTSIIEETRKGYAMLCDVIEDRRKNPIDGDIMTSLIQAEEQGDRLSKDELISMVAGLVTGGSDTTVHLISTASHILLRQPEVLEQLKTEPELIRSVLEEALRFDGGGKVGLPRYAAEDADFAGVKIKKGEMVMLMLHVGMRDPAVFPNPDGFDARRDMASLLVFGNGPHYCLGANLARLEGGIAVGTLFRRFPEMKLLAPPTYAPHPAFRKMETLNVKLKPTAA